MMSPLSEFNMMSPLNVLFYTITGYNLQQDCGAPKVLAI